MKDMWYKDSTGVSAGRRMFKADLARKLGHLPATDQTATLYRMLCLNCSGHVLEDDHGPES